MRKIVKRSDGLEEIVEGTPSEINEYEKIKERAEVPKKTPGVIKGKEDSPDISKIISEEIERNRNKRTRNPYVTPWSPLIPLDKESSPWVPWNPNIIWIASCSQCHQSRCICSHSYLGKVIGSTSTLDQIYRT